MKLKLIAGISLAATLASTAVATLAGPSSSSPTKAVAAVAVEQGRVGNTVMACNEQIYLCCWQRGANSTDGWYPLQPSAGGQVLCPDGTDSYTGCTAPWSQSPSSFYAQGQNGWATTTAPATNSCGAIFAPKKTVTSPPSSSTSKK